MTLVDGADAAQAIDWAVAGHAFPGESECGDRSIVAAIPGGAIVAVIDGLGHGREAAAAAVAAAAAIAALQTAPIDAIVRACHERLRATRGAVMTIAAVEPAAAAISWIGVGNVDGVLIRSDPYAEPPRFTLLARGGIVGCQLPPLRIARHPIAPGDLLVLATDGIGSRFAGEVPGGGRPQAIADAILAQHGKDSDDALVLVARVRGPGRR